jgi:hypothetical protein
MKKRKITKEFIICNQLSATVEHNGYKGGDAGHGGYVEITFQDMGGTAMELKYEAENYEGLKINKVNVHETDLNKVTLRFMGDSERDTLVSSLRFILQELESNIEVKEDIDRYIEYTF